MAAFLALALVLFAGSSCSASSSRIVGGERVTIDHYPSLVQVENRNIFSGYWSQSCAGSILNSLYILSSAQCFSGDYYNANDRRIRAGSTYRNAGGQLAYVQVAYHHPTWGFNGYDGDITVVRLIAPLTYNPVVQQIMLIGAGNVIPENLLTTYAGWGRTGPDSLYSSELRHGDVYTVNNAICRERYAQLGQVVTDNMICAGVLDIGRVDACEGDAGGPLYYTNILVGVISWGVGCGNATFPFVNTAVAPYTNWIVATAES